MKTVRSSSSPQERGRQAVWCKNRPRQEQTVYRHGNSPQISNITKIVDRRPICQFRLCLRNGTIVHYLVLLGLVSIFLSHPVTASILGRWRGQWSITFSHHWFFRSKRKHSETLSKFVAVGGLGLVLNAAIMYVLVTIASIHYLLAQIAATGIVLLWNFFGNRFWTFADDTRNI